MRYGFYLPTRGGTATPDALETLVRRGEALGFASVMIAAAFFQSAVYRMLMRLAPHIHHVAAAFLVSAGVFIKVAGPRYCGPSIWASRLGAFGIRLQFWQRLEYR